MYYRVAIPAVIHVTVRADDVEGAYQQGTLLQDYMSGWEEIAHLEDIGPTELPGLLSTEIDAFVDIARGEVLVEYDIRTGTLPAQ